MEEMLICLCLMLACGSLALELLAAAAFLWTQKGKNVQTAALEAEKPPEELPEEREARLMAAEAQRLYEQGFVNLMRYDGSPGRKECEDL